MLSERLSALVPGIDVLAWRTAEVRSVLGSVVLPAETLEERALAAERSAARASSLNLAMGLGGSLLLALSVVWTGARPEGASALPVLLFAGTVALFLAVGYVLAARSAARSAALAARYRALLSARFAAARELS